MENTEQAGSKVTPKAEGDKVCPVNYYDVLDVHPGASRLEIRESYLRLKSTYSDGSAALYSLISEEEARATMAKVEEAFRVLNDEIQRQEYDQKWGFVGKMSNSARELVGEYDEANRRQAERLGYLRDQVRREDDLWSTTNSVDGENESTVVRTTRSTLPVIKTKATGAGSKDLTERFEALIECNDPGDGDLCRQLREAAGVSESEMQERTKISIGYIRDIEANRFERLPQPVYVKGFLRSYFRYLMVPEPERLVKAYAERLDDWQAKQKS